MHHRFASTLAGLLVLALGVGAGIANPATANAEARLLIDAQSGRVLRAENATQPWYPASLSKLMTTYVTLRAVKDGRIRLDNLVTVSANALSQAPSKMGFPVGTRMTVDNALKMLLVHSANDMAVVLAEGVSGSVEQFAAEMNQTSARLGMTQSHWDNPNGLPDDKQITSARDLAILARGLMHDFPEYDFYWHIGAIKFGHRVMRNYNKLIDRYPGADGMKTGFTCSSGYNLIASATRNGRRLIAIVLGASSGKARSDIAANMLESGFKSSSALGWLMPSLGTVEALQPIAASPPDLREDTCGPHRRHRTEEDEAQAAPGMDVDSGSNAYASIFAGSHFLGSGAQHVSLLGPLTPSAEPITVTVIAPPGAPADPDALMARGHKRRGIARMHGHKGRKSAVINVGTHRTEGDKGKDKSAAAKDGATKGAAKEKSAHSRPAAHGTPAAAHSGKATSGKSKPAKGAGMKSSAGSRTAAQ